MTRASDLAKLLGAGATINDGTTITTADNTVQLSLTSTDADANSGPELDLYRNSSSPADADLMGKVTFRGRNDNSQDVNYGQIVARAEDASDGTEDGRVDFRAIIGGTEGTFMKYHVPSGNEVVFNDGSLDIDFRVESDGNANMLVVDAGQNNVGIGTSPTSTRILHVQSNTANYFNTMIDHASSSDNVYALDLFFSGQSPDNNTSEFVRCRDTGQVRLVIDSDGDITNHDNSYGAISDEKLKEQIADASSQWDDIKALKVRKFKMKDDVSTKGDSDDLWKLGVVAQEVETAGMNNLVRNKKDLDPDTNEELGTTTKTVKYSILYMKAVKALQEAMTRIETLEAKVTALESA
jgi:hypothetical protein